MTTIQVKDFNVRYGFNNIASVSRMEKKKVKSLGMKTEMEVDMLNQRTFAYKDDLV